MAVTISWRARNPKERVHATFKSALGMREALCGSFLPGGWWTPTSGQARCKSCLKLMKLHHAEEEPSK